MPLELYHRFPPDPREIARARRVLWAWLAEGGIRGDDAEDLVLVMSELATNAVKAAAHADPEVEPIEVGLTVWREADTIVVEVSGPSTGLDPTALQRRSWDSVSESGRGLAIVDVLSDSLEAEHSGRSTVVRATKSVHPELIDLREAGHARR